MIAFLLVCVFVFFISLFSGAFVADVIKWRISRFDEFYLGFVLTNSFFTLISLFFPVSFLASIIFFILIVTFCFFKLNWTITYVTDIYNAIKNQIFKYPVFSIILSVFIVIAFSVSLYTPMMHRDAGLYHIQAIKWITEYPVIPGLANLHVRFGFNNNIFTFFAATTWETVLGQPIYCLNFIFVAVFIFYLFTRINISIDQRKYMHAVGHIIILIFIYDFCFKWLSTTSPDILALVGFVYIFLRANCIENNNDIGKLVIIFSLYLITVKLSVLPVLILAVYTFFINKYFKLKREHLVLHLLPFLIVVPWLIRNIVQTGWLVFPFPFLDLFSFKWKVPVANVIATKNDITGYARIPGNVFDATSMTFGESIPVWLKNQSIFYIVFLFISVLLACVFLILTLLKKINSNRYFTVSIISGLIGVVYWFLTAPDFRFGLPFMLILFVLPLLMIKVDFHINRIIFVIIFSTFLCYFIKTNWFHPWHFLKNVSKYYFLPYKMEQSENGKLVEYNYFLIDGKIKCLYPINTDLCFDKSLPCSSRLIKNLHLRGSELSDGFYVLP